jgi:nucleoside-diphosphate-sugar epimerase
LDAEARTKEDAVSGELVLVTGGSGFVGAHCILKLLDAGYRVRTTVRSLSREPDVRAMLEIGGAKPGDALSFARADLLSDDGWPEAVAGCDFVLHVASPFPVMMPRDEDELIRPAREGALRALRAARDGGVKRVVMTSSFAAIGYGVPHADGSPFTEEDWTDPDGQVSAYVKSKTLAERAAWDFIEREGGGLELAVVNPVGIFGPVLGKDVSSSIELVRRMMNGSLPALPRMYFGVVDVRDVADLHLLAMTDPAAAGNRFLAIAGDPLTLPQMAAVLRDRMGQAARRVPKRVMPDGILKSIAVFSPSLRQIVPELGRAKPATSAKARRVLGWNPRSREDALVATGESLIRIGAVK